MAGGAGFDVLIVCAFDFDAHLSEFNKLGRIAVKVINHLGDEVVKVFGVE